MHALEVEEPHMFPHAVVWSLHPPVVTATFLMIHAHSLWTWSAMIQAALTFALPTVTALTATLSRSSATKAAAHVSQRAVDTVRLWRAHRCVAHPILPISFLTHALVMEAPSTCQLAVQLHPLVVTATF